MTRVALKGLFGRKLRAALTAIAIVLGVAMVSGTYVLTDTIKAAFSTVFTTVYKHTDAVITGQSAIGGNGRNGQDLPPSVPASLLTRVQALPGVAAATGGIGDRAHLVGHNGKTISHGGSPGLAFSYDPAGERFNPLTLTKGTWPAGPDQVAIDSSTASKDHFSVGDQIGVVALGPVERFKIVGTVQIAGVSSLGGSTMSVFTLPTAQRLFNKQGKFDEIDVAAKPGVSPAALVNQIRPLLPPTGQVRTGAAQAQKSTNDTSGFLTIFQSFLLAFGGIALFVGSFVIANTLSITIAQRTRELATLRTLGATRRQVLRSVMIEAFVIGLLASIVGLFLGLGLAKGLNALFVSFGIDLPQAGTVFKTRTIVVALLVGVVITLLAALRPAWRATHVPPIAAVREGAVLPPSRFARFGPYAAAATVAVAFALMLVGLFVSSLSTAPAAAGDRDRRGRAVRRRRDAGAEARAAARPCARLAGREVRWRGGLARPRQCDPQPGADLIDRVGADDRARARDARRRPRGRAAIAVRGRGQRGVRRRLRADLDRQLHPDRHLLRECPEQGAGR